MALQGEYNFKGIEISEAYIKIDNVNYSASHAVETTEKTAAVYNSDGSLKTAAVMQDTWKETSPASFSGKVYKDKAERDYLGQPDEVEAFSYNIASELLRRHDKETIINAFRTGDLSILKDSVNFVAYLSSFEDTDNKTMRNLINKILKYLENLD